jgi:hypothetical protein
VLVLGLAALYRCNTRTGVTVTGATDGELDHPVGRHGRVLGADEVHPDDRYGCEGIDTAVVGTPGRGRMAASSPGTDLIGLITVTTTLAGDVTVECDPDAALP